MKMKQLKSTYLLIYYNDINELLHVIFDKN